MRLEAVIFGGGVAGLWLLDELSRRGHSALLLETAALGQGQTIASQGIIHGGLKYSLQGFLTPSAKSIRDMPATWRACLAGQRGPDLSRTPRRADFCYLWSTGSFGSRWGMLGARLGLRATHRLLSDDERPFVLAGCVGSVARLEEPVLSPPGLLANLAAPHWHRILLIDGTSAVTWNMSGPGDVRSIVLTQPGTAQQLEVIPRTVIFTAGAGNAALRRQVGLESDVMQRRPLHMVMARGQLPVLNGHCIDGAKTRLTITSDEDTAGRTIWQIGGQVAENGVRMPSAELIAHAQSEVQAVFPGIDLTGTEWATERIDRAEGATSSGERPDRIQVLREGNTLTAWPTKLALAPQLAERIAAGTRAPATNTVDIPTVLHDWPRPDVARPPWETCSHWEAFDQITSQPGQAA